MSQNWKPMLEIGLRRNVLYLLCDSGLLKIFELWLTNVCRIFRSINRLIEPKVIQIIIKNVMVYWLIYVYLQIFYLNAASWRHSANDLSMIISLKVSKDCFMVYVFQNKCYFLLACMHYAFLKRYSVIKLKQQNKEIILKWHAVQLA